MPEPTLAELRTARAHVRRTMECLENEPNKTAAIVDMKLVEASFTQRITQLEEKEQRPMQYIISGDDNIGYTVAEPSGLFRYSLCPCCGYKIETRAKAEILAENLAKIYTKDDNTANIPKDQSDEISQG